MLSPAATGHASPNWQPPLRRSDLGADSNLTTNSAASLDCVARLTGEVCAYGIGAAALASPVKSMLAYSRSLSRRWYASMTRTVPDLDRITTDWVWAPPPL